MLIRIITIYNEEIYRIEKSRNKFGVYTDKGFIPFEDIKFIDIIGVIKGDDKNEN